MEGLALQGLALQGLALLPFMEQPQPSEPVSFAAGFLLFQGYPT